MKSMISAIALLVAAPALAQAVPAANPHAGHSAEQYAKHQGQGHEGHGEHKDCCKDGKMACCEKMKQQDKSMKCCEKMKQHDKDAADHNGHAGH